MISMKNTICQSERLYRSEIERTGMRVHRIHDDFDEMEAAISEVHTSKM